MPRTKPSQRNIYNPSKRNIKLEKKMHKVKEPKPFMSGIASKTPKGKTVPILGVKANNTIEQKRIKGNLRNYKQSVAKAAINLERRVTGKPFLSDSVNMRRVRMTGALSKRKKPVAKSGFSPRKVSGKARPTRSVGRGGGAGGGGLLGKGQIR